MSGLTGESPRRTIRGGRDYSVWPALKLARARDLASELGHSMIKYRVSLGDQARPVISEDRMSVTFFAQVAQEPPVFEWSLLYGDAIHNYRSALDALVWQVVHLDGAAPPAKYRNKVYFPFAKSVEAWEKAISTTLANVPPLLQNRLLAPQPFLTEDSDESIGLYLHEMDIADKHMAMLQLELTARDQSTFSWSFSLEQVAEQGTSPWNKYEWLATDEPIRDGAAICRFTMNGRLLTAELRQLPLAPMVSVFGRRHDAMHLLRLIDAQVEASFQVIEGYEVDPGAPS